MNEHRYALIALFALTVFGCKKPAPGIGPVPDSSATGPVTPPSIPPPSASEAPERVAGWLVGDVREDKWALAYSIMASKYRATVSLDDFTRTLRAHPYFYPPKSLDSYKYGTKGGTAYVIGLIESSSGTYEAEYSMLLEGGEWRIAGLRVGGSEVLPHFTPAAASSAPRK